MNSKFQQLFSSCSIKKHQFLQLIVSKNAYFSQDQIMSKNYGMEGMLQRH